MVWEVKTTDEYDAWFLEQVEDGQASICMKVGLLEEYGLLLPCPHADTLKGSELNNLKELRAQTENHIFRVVFIRRSRYGLIPRSSAAAVDSMVIAVG